MYPLWLFILFLFALLLHLCRTEKVQAPQFLKCDRSCQRYLFRVLWDAGYFPEVGYKVDNHEVHIAFPYSKVALECGWNPWEYDDLVRFRSKKKAQELSEQGWKFIHFSPEEIYGQPKVCLNQVKEAVSLVERVT
jgi:hypothetical protein